MAITASTKLQTKSGQFNVNYHTIDDNFCVSFSMGNLSQSNIPVRIHSSCLFSESILSIDCDCSLQLKKSFEFISKHGGIIVYLYQEGRGIGLENKIKAMELERTKNIDTAEAFKTLHFDLDPRNYNVAIQALKDLKVSKNIRLITNNPRKMKQLEDAGFTIVERVVLSYPKNKLIKNYLKVKKEKLGHKL